jgi:HEPN domain-containing protein
MNDKAKYWLELCDDDLMTAKWLLQGGRLLHMGFFCNMIVEKALKAVIAEQTDEIPPKIHDLPKLADKGGIYHILSDEQLRLIDELEPLNIDVLYLGYRERMVAALTGEKSKQLLSETEAFLWWIKNKLTQ